MQARQPCSHYNHDYVTTTMQSLQPCRHDNHAGTTSMQSLQPCSHYNHAVTTTMQSLQPADCAFRHRAFFWSTRNNNIMKCVPSYHLVPRISLGNVSVDWRCQPFHFISFHFVSFCFILFHFISFYNCYHLLAQSYCYLLVRSDCHLLVHIDCHLLVHI